MILKKITIENFRCFKNYEVDLTPGITVFIGKNGAGKTSLLNAIRYGLSVFFSNDSTMGDDLLISGNPDLKVISTLATDFYRAQNADLPAVDLTINMEAEFNDIPLNWEYYKRSTSGASLFVSKYQQAYRTLMAEYHNSDQLPLFVFYSDSFPHIDTRTSDFAKKAIKEQGYIIRNFAYYLSLIHISEPTRLGMISYAVFCLKKFFLMIRRPPRSTLSPSSAASDVYKRQGI